MSTLPKSSPQFTFSPLPLGEGTSQEVAATWPAKRLVFLAGEVSGDHLGAAVLASLASGQAERQVRVHVAGTGGAAMAGAGMSSLLPLDRFNYMGWGPVLANLPALLHNIGQVSQAAVAASPDAVIGIDAQGYCGRVMKAVPSQGATRKIQLVAPTVWGRHPERAAKVAKVLDRMLCIYPFEPPLFEAHGLTSDFVGHPLVRQPAPNIHAADDEEEEGQGQGQDYRQIAGLAEGTRVLAVLPGSRRAEVDVMLPIFAAAARRIEAAMGQGVQFVIPVAPLVRERVKAQASRLLPQATIVTDPLVKTALFRDADSALCCAGTAVIELALSRTPIVLGYRQDWLTNWIGRRVWKTFGSIANINAGEQVHPEFMFDACRPQALAQACVNLLQDPAHSASVSKIQYDSVQKMGIRDEMGDLRSPADIAAARIFDEILG